jgi:hypothetical protein
MKSMLDGIRRESPFQETLREQNHRYHRFGEPNLYVLRDAVHVPLPQR